MAISMPPSISSTVGPMVSASSSLTILLEMIERPRSPCSTRPIYSANWTGIGAVEAELEADRRDGLGLGIGPGDDHRRIGGHHLQETEAQEENPEQRGERDQQAVDNLSSHAPSSDRFGQGGTRRFPDVS